jgi:hypothetical protein
MNRRDAAGIGPVGTGASSARTPKTSPPAELAQPAKRPSSSIPQRPFPPATVWKAARGQARSCRAVAPRPQIGGRFAQASPRSARCRPYSNSGRM